MFLLQVEDHLCHYIDKTNTLMNIYFYLPEDGIDCAAQEAFSGFRWQELGSQDGHELFEVNLPVTWDEKGSSDDENHNQKTAFLQVSSMPGIPQYITGGQYHEAAAAAHCTTDTVSCNSWSFSVLLLVLNEKYGWVNNWPCSCLVLFRLMRPWAAQHS